MTDSVCIGCGLCCDGTVVSHLAVADESDLGAPLRTLGVEIIAAADPPVFELPCPAVVEGVCTVHALHRPAACGHFECGVSRAVLDGAMTPTDARSIIGRTLELREAVRAGRTHREELESVLDRDFRWWSSHPGSP